LPGGYSHVELSASSPIKQVLSFPQELVMLGRATVLIKGIAKRLEIPWSLASKWGPACQACVSEADKGQANFKVPVWAKMDSSALGRAHGPGSAAEGSGSAGKGVVRQVRFADVARLSKAWAGGKVKALGLKAFEKLPKRAQEPLRRRALDYTAKKMERDELKRERAELGDQ